MKVDFRLIAYRPRVWEARIYERGSYEERSPYCGSFVLRVQNGRAWTSLLTGVWNREAYRQTAVFLRALGVRWVTYETKGRLVESDLASTARYRQEAGRSAA